MPTDDRQASTAAQGRFKLGKFLRHPLVALRYRRQWGEWPLIWMWEVGNLD